MARRGDNSHTDAWGYGLEHYMKTKPNPCFECGVMTKGKHHSPSDVN